MEMLGLAFGIAFAISMVILGYFTTKAEAEYDEIANRVRNSLDNDMANFLISRNK